MTHYSPKNKEAIKPPLTCKNLGGGFYFDTKDKLLYTHNKPIKLSIKEKELLCVLLDARGQIVTSESLEHLIWSQTPVANSTLRTLIYRLRLKLNYKIIETVPSIGWRIKTSS